MDNKPFLLTNNEREIMDLLWRQDKPLSRADIIELSPERSWKASSIHILLNQLLGKGAIAVDGFVKIGKHYGRTFSATLSEDDYNVMQFKRGDSYRNFKPSSALHIFASLIDGKKLDVQTLERLDALISAKWEEIK